MGRVFLGYSPAGKAVGRILATGNSDATIRLWDPATGQHGRTIKGPITLRTMNGRIMIRAAALGRLTSYTSAVTFSPDGRVLAAANHESAHLWDPATGQHLRTLAHKGFGKCVAFSHDERMLATGGDESIVRLWG